MACGKDESRRHVLVRSPTAISPLDRLRRRRLRVQGDVPGAGEEVSVHGLGRLVAPDDRDRRFLARAVLFPNVAPKPRIRPYQLGPTLDQGETPQCVGYSCRDKLASAPITMKEGQGPDAPTIYAGAQRVDEWEGEDYEGTSVRGGFKFLTARGHLKSYVWLTMVSECEHFIRQGYGTIVLGTNWYAGMSNVDAQGFVRPSGWIAGGHAYHLFWMKPDVKEAWCKNSWGPRWGVRLNGRDGCFKLTYDTLARLLREDGEAGAGLEVKVA